MTDDSEYESFYHSAPYQEMTSALDKEHEALNLDISILQNPDLKIEFEGKILNKDERTEQIELINKELESKIEI